jgi:hypothetical protein
MPNKISLLNILNMKIRITLFILPLMLISWSLVGQLEHEWSFGIGSKESEGPRRAFADHAGNIYSMLDLKDTADIDPGPGQQIIVPEGGTSLVLAKYDEDGNLVFGYPFYVNDNPGGSIHELAYNQIRLTIDFHDSLVYERNGLRESLFNQHGHYHAILTLDLDGEIINSHFFPSTSDFYLTSFHTLPDGRMLLAGTFDDSLALNPQSPFTLYSPGNSDGFILMADQNYNTIWATQFKGNGYDYISSLSVTNEDHIYFTAGFFDSLSLVTSQGPINVVSHGEEDGFFGYMNLSGEIEKVFFIHGPGSDEVSDIESDETGNIYICGYFEQTVNFAGTSQPPQFRFSAGESDGFVAKYNVNGNLDWVGIYADTGYGGVQSLDLKRGNEIYLNGYFTLKADLNPGPDSLIVHTGERASPFISKLSTDGEFLWSIPFISKDYAFIRSLIILTETSRIVANGYYYDSLHCSEIQGENWLDTDQGADIFLMSFLEENVTTATHDQSSTEIGVYPNPTSGQVHINAENEIKQVSVQSLDGKLINTWTFTPSQHQEMNLHDLPPGLYYMSIQTGEQWSTEKIVIQ